MSKKEKDSIIEQLAKLEHNQWMHWSKSVSSEVSEENKKTRPYLA